MVIVYDEAMLRDYVRRAEELQRAFPILVDHFLENATEVDVDALADGTDVVIAGVMQHIEEAGIHSGDSSCVLPAVTIGEPQHRALCEYTDQAGQGTERGRADERSVRHSERPGLRPGSESARLAGPFPTSARPPACRWPRLPRA